MKQTRQHNFYDYQADDNIICHDNVRITSKYNMCDVYWGYMSRYDGKQFIFEHDNEDDIEDFHVGDRVRYNYSDWKIEYL